MEEELPAFPRLSGLLTEMCDAICPSIPYEFKIAAAITHWGLVRSGKDTLEGESSLQPRFYTCLIKEPGWGKTAAMNEVRKYMKVCGKYSMMSSVDSGPALVDEFEDQTKGASLPARVLLDTDEMTDLFEKSKVTSQGRNSLFTELLKLYESNRTGNRSRKNGKTQIEDAHLSVVAGATPQGYERMWTGTGGGSTGLQSRFILVSTSAPKMGTNRLPTNDKALETILPALLEMAMQENVTVRMDDDARAMLADWWGSSDRDKPSESRVDDMVKRLLIILGVTTGRHTIDRELMAQAIAFGDYVIAAREKFNAPDSYTWIQANEDAIRKVGRRHAAAMTMNECRRRVQPGRKPGGIGPFLQGWKNLIAVGELVESHKSHKGTMNYRLAS